MIASAGFWIGAGGFAGVVGLPGQCFVVADGIAEVVGVNKIFAGVVRRIDVDHLHFFVIRSLQKFQDFQIVALDIEVVAVELARVPSRPELSASHGRSVPMERVRA